MQEYEQIMEYMSRISNVEQLENIKRVVDLRISLINTSDMEVLFKIINANLEADESFRYSALHTSLMVVVYDKWKATTGVKDDTMLACNISLTYITNAGKYIIGHASNKEIYDTIKKLYDAKEYKQCVFLINTVIGSNFGGVVWHG